MVARPRTRRLRRDRGRPQGSPYAPTRL